MSKNEQTPKTVVSGRGYIEDELIENLKNTEDFQRSVDLYQEGRLDKINLSVKEKQQKIEQINISHNEITREIDNNNSNQEVRDKVNRDLKGKDRVDDVNGYSWE